MNEHTSHITIDGKPLCHNHGHLLGQVVGSRGNGITCAYSDHRRAKATYKFLKGYLVNANVRLKGGPCPIQGDGGKK